MEFWQEDKALESNCTSNIFKAGLVKNVVTRKIHVFLTPWMPSSQMKKDFVNKQKILGRLREQWRGLGILHRAIVCYSCC